MRFKLILPLVFTLSALCSVLSGTAHAQSVEAKFETGVSAFKKGDLNAARTSFQEVLDQDAFNARALFNLGLVEQKSGHLGKAIGLWRKALAAHPGDRAPRSAIDWAKTKLERSEIPHEVEAWETLRSAVLARVSIEKFLITSAALLLLSGWLMLRHLGQRRQSALDERPLPPFPTAAAAFAILFAFSTALTAAKAIDMETVRGTILVKKIEARSAPDPAATPLFDLYEGLEVVVKRSAGDWLQVTYPGASSGWIPKSSVLATSDKVGS
jgi:tetratricopeptide (TPR) repeat protein